MSWTEQQKNAIELRNKSVIVSAAAGSGKTAVLTERLAQLISQPDSNIRADRIVVVTFTNDAASELKNRLDLKLRELLNKNPNDNHLLKQQILLQSAKISTINSFCFDLLRDNINEQGITSGFSVLDESENEIILNQSIDELINYYCLNEHDKISILYDKLCLKNDANLVEVIRLANDFLSSVAFRNQWLDKAVIEYEKSPFESVYCKKIFIDGVNQLKNAVKLALNCQEMLDDIFFDADEEKNKSVKKSYIQADEDKAIAEKALKIFISGKVPTDSEIEFCCNFERLVTVRNKEGVDTELRENYKAKRDLIIKTVRSVMHSFDNFESDFVENKDVVLILSEMLKMNDDIIWKKKCEKNAISFDDGERLVLELLSKIDDNGNISQSATAKRMSDYYDIVMIDEYQDSNNKQDLIFKLLSKNCHLNDDGALIYGNNVFLVGDVKQSIYRFRLANPKNFINTIKNSEPYSETSADCNTSIALNKNFRSSHEVIDFVNYIFSQVMSEQCGDVNYNDQEKLYFGAIEYETDISNDRKTNIAFINTNQDEDEEDVNDDESFSNELNVEAAYTADKIFDMIKNRYQTVLKDGSVRNCEPSDFCILIRVNKHAKNYIEELKKRGIDARGQEEKGYLSSREIAVLLDVLRIINNPLLDVSMAAVMMSPMYMFEFEEIAFLRTLSKSENLYTVMSNLVSGQYSDFSDVFFAERCKDFLDSLSSYRLAAVTMTVSELIQKIYDNTDFISVMQLYTDGEKKRANLRALIQYAKSYENSVSFEGNGGLSGFIRYIDKVIESGKDFEQGKISALSGNYVSVKTIHKSKGLEFPYVFIAETSSKFRKDYPQILCASDNRIGFVLYNQKLVRRYRTIPYIQIFNDNSAETISEELRLLYVALTRAKQKLFINLKCNEKILKNVSKLVNDYVINSVNINELANGAVSLSSWIWMSLFEHESFKSIAERTELIDYITDLPKIKNSDDLFTTEYVNESIEDKKLTVEIPLDAEPDLKICNEINELINYQYDKILSETPAKMSVTQITKKFKNEESNFDFKLKRPRFMSESMKLTGAEMGTAIHTFFQYCNFDLARENPESEIKSMIEKGYLSCAQAESINIENVKAFFENNLYKRIKKAESIWREKKFLVAIAELDIDNSLMNSLKKSDGMIKGIVDLIFRESGKLIMVDYKSDRGASAASLKERYKMQLDLYRAAIELITNEKVEEIYLYSFELKDTIKIEL